MVGVPVKDVTDDNDEDNGRADGTTRRVAAAAARNAIDAICWVGCWMLQHHQQVHHQTDRINQKYNTQEKER
jgi:hypothetical protein